MLDSDMPDPRHERRQSSFARPGMRQRTRGQSFVITAEANLVSSGSAIALSLAAFNLESIAFLINKWQRVPWRG